MVTLMQRRQPENVVKCNPSVFCSVEEGSGSARGQISGAVCSSWFGNSLPSAFCEQLGLSRQMTYQQYSNQTWMV